jgi:hypothetical protein
MWHFRSEIELLMTLCGAVKYLRRRSKAFNIPTYSFIGPAAAQNLITLRRSNEAEKAKLPFCAVLM